MAIIYSYPEKTTPFGGDFLVITDSEQPAPNKNRTKSLKIENLANYVVTSTSATTGSGTTNTLPVWTNGPNGGLGDSMITQNSSGNIATIAGRLAVNADLSVTGYARFNGQVQDGANSPGATGQLLTSTVAGVEWKDINDILEYPNKTIPSIVWNSQAGQILTNENSQLAIGLGSVYPTAVNYPLWIQGRKNDSTPRNICLQPVEGSVQIGVDNFNAGKSSLATGYENQINGDFSFAVGKSNVLGITEATAAIGRANEVTGLGSTAIGFSNEITKKNTVVIGQENVATGESSFILGRENTTQKINNVAIGRSNNLNSPKVITVGFGNTSSGVNTDDTTCFGAYNNTITPSSHLFGMRLQSYHPKEIIIGKHNAAPDISTGGGVGANVVIGVGTGQFAGANMNAVEYYGYNDGSIQVIHKALYNASSYADDTAAASGGVPLGGLYRTGSTVKIRMT